MRFICFSIIKGFTSDSSLVTYQEDTHSEQTSSVGSPGLVCKSENSMQISDQVTMLIDPAQIQDTEHTQQVDKSVEHTCQRFILNYLSC